MNIAIIQPATSKNKKKGLFSLLHKWKGRFNFPSFTHTQRIELVENLHLVIYSIESIICELIQNEGQKKRIRTAILKRIKKDSIYHILEHPMLRDLYCSSKIDFNGSIVKEIVINRFCEILKLIQGVGDISHREIVVTGRSSHLEQAIEKLIMNVKSLNILLPEGAFEPIEEAEQAFIETGIPVHITTDGEVLDRSAIWIRFPDDDKSFDILPQRYMGIIIDLGNLKIIDTKNKKIFNIYLEFSDVIKRKIGHNILNYWEKGALEENIIALCANAWDINALETSTRLDMRISFKS